MRLIASKKKKDFTRIPGTCMISVTNSSFPQPFAMFVCCGFEFLVTSTLRFRMPLAAVLARFLCVAHRDDWGACVHASVLVSALRVRVTVPFI